MNRWIRQASVVCSVAFVVATARAQCPTRAPAFTVDGAIGGVNDMAVFDDGSGSKLYAAGAVSAAGDVAARGVARWDGTRWEAVGALLGSTTGASSISALAVFNDGAGAKLYASGNFTTGAGDAADYVASWNGSAWTTVGAGPGTEVYSLRVLDFGQGPQLAAGVYAWGSSPLRVWNGSSWQSYSGGVFAGRVIGAEMYNGSLYVAAEGNFSNGVLRWNGAGWTGIGPALAGTMRSLVVLTDGTGTKLYCGTDGGLHVWNGSNWSSLGTPVNMSILRTAVLDTGGGPRLHVFGYCFQGGQTSESVLRWTGTAWGPVGISQPSNAVATSFANYDSGSGSSLYVGGNFGALQGDLAQGVARWDGQHWRRLAAARGVRGQGFSPEVQSFASFTPLGAQRPWVYVGGNLALAGDTEVRNIAAWDGANWHALGSGVGTTTQHVSALAMYDEPGVAPPALFAGGDFVQAGGVGTAYLARWNGNAWSKVGTSPLGGLGGACRALIVHDDGSGAGECLYAGGSFNLVNGNVAAKNVARWNGTTWQALDAGLDSGVWAFALYDDPLVAGPAQLYAVGQFAASGATPMQRIARWNGATWNAVGAFPSTVTQTHLVAWNSGAGDELFVGGLADGNVRSWNGTAWSALTAYGVPLAAFDDGTGEQLYITGGRWDGAALASFAGLTSNVAATLDEGDGVLALWSASWGNYDGTACIGVGRYADPCGVLRTYCTAMTNSQGCLPTIGWSGVPSVSTLNAFAINATQLLNQESGLFFYGVHGRNAAPFFGGTLCVKAPLVRTGLQSTAGSSVGVDCSGALALDFNAWMRAGSDPGLFPGVRVEGQFWSRDPAAPSTVNLSEGLEFEIQP